MTGGFLPSGKIPVGFLNAGKVSTVSVLVDRRAAFSFIMERSAV